MNGRTKLALGLGAFLTLQALFALLAAGAVYYDLGAEERSWLAGMLAPRLDLVLGLAALGLALAGGLFVWGYQAYVGGLLGATDGARIIATANRSHRLAAAGPAEVRALAAAINQLADQNEVLARDLEAKIAAARASVEEERNRLAALMSEFSQGVLVCNLEGRILLYNERARHALAAGTQAASLIGLGRSIYAVVDGPLLNHALDTVRARLARHEANPDARFVAPLRGGQLVRVHVAPVLGAEKLGDTPPLGGFVLTLEDITRSFERETRRDTVLHALTEGSRASLANIRSAAETLADFPDCDPQQRERFVGVIRDEVRHLSSRLDRTTADYADSLKTRWPLEEMRGGDLVSAARSRIEDRLALLTKVEGLDESIWIRTDSYTLLQALTYFAARLRDEYGVRELRFDLSAAGRLAQLDLIWSGVVISPQTLYPWEIDPMHAGGEDSPLTLRDVIERHDGELVFMADKARHRALCRVLLPLATPVQPPAPAAPRYGESRPEFYDFDLFHQARQTPELDQRPLSELIYTVFDTETTGLEPGAGDEIIAIGAVRIVNNRLLRAETYEQLVDPRRPISEASTAIHGITLEAVRGQPGIERVLPRFHEFCADTVLVGHNVAFDLSFLKRKQEQAGVRFEQPVLDTLLLSGVVHPNQASHSLEQIAVRLGVAVSGRHTALGDALVTAEVFLRMLPLLAAQGIRTLGEARRAAENSLYARVEY
jgi:DNA polymerase-3 subunit epsilon